MNATCLRRYVLRLASPTLQVHPLGGATADSAAATTTTTTAATTAAATTTTDAGAPDDGTGCGPLSKALLDRWAVNNTVLVGFTNSIMWCVCACVRGRVGFWF